MTLNKIKGKNIFQIIRVANREKKGCRSISKDFVENGWYSGDDCITTSQFALLQRYKNQKQGGQLYCVSMAQYS